MGAATTRPATARWVGIRDCNDVAQLLARTLPRRGRSDLARYRLKVLLTPHLTTGDHAATVGIEPDDRGLLRRAGDAFRWVARRDRGIDRAPAVLARSSRWRVVNFASDPSQRPCPAVIHVGLALLRLADDASADLSAAAVDTRAASAYRRFGFEGVGGPQTAVLELRRRPRSP